MADPYSGNKLSVLAKTPAMPDPRVIELVEGSPRLGAPRVVERARRARSSNSVNKPRSPLKPPVIQRFCILTLDRSRVSSAPSTESPCAAAAAIPSIAPDPPPATPSKAWPPPKLQPRKAPMDVLSAVKMDRAVRHIDLLDFIITQDAHVLRTNESQLLKKAAEQPATYALELLHASGVALHPYETASGRGWQARDCPFRAAIACRRDQNVRRLLELGAKPGPELLADLSSLPVEAQWAFANHGYWL